MKHLLSATLILLSTLSYAEEVPNSFSSGETISSSQINANFSFLADAMARGNVKAMMVCRQLGLADFDNPDITEGEAFITPTLIFSECIAPDNTTLVDDCNICFLDDSLSAGYCAYSEPIDRSITANELIVNQWLLHYIAPMPLSDGNDSFLYLFYKISDQ